MNPSATIVTAMFVTAASVIVGTITAKRRPTFRPVAGVGITGLVLLVAAQNSNAAPVAAKLSVVIAVTALLTSGGKAAIGVASYFAAGNPAPGLAPGSTTPPATGTD